MGATLVDRNTPQRDPRDLVLPVAANSKVIAGTIGVFTAAGHVAGATTATTLTGAGRIEETVDNSTGAAGDKSVRVKRGCFQWANDGNVTAAHRGKPAYAVDNQTVAPTDGGGTRSVIGTIRDVDAQGVWVEI